MEIFFECCRKNLILKNNYVYAFSYIELFELHVLPDGNFLITTIETIKNQAVKVTLHLCFYCLY